MGKKLTNKIIKNTTCFSVHEKLGVACRKRSCSCWFNNPETNNCVILCAKKKGPHKQEEIGSYFGLTRMRVCQILKDVVKKVEDNVKDSEVIQSLMSSDDEM